MEGIGWQGLRDLLAEYWFIAVPTLLIAGFPLSFASIEIILDGTRASRIAMASGAVTLIFALATIVDLGPYRALSIFIGVAASATVAALLYLAITTKDRNQTTVRTGLELVLVVATSTLLVLMLNRYSEIPPPTARLVAWNFLSMVPLPVLSAWKANRQLHRGRVIVLEKLNFSAAKTAQEIYAAHRKGWKRKERISLLDLYSAEVRRLDEVAAEAEAALIMDRRRKAEEEAEKVIARRIENERVEREEEEAAESRRIKEERKTAAIAKMAQQERLALDDAATIDRELTSYDVVARLNGLLSETFRWSGGSEHEKVPFDSLVKAQGLSAGQVLRALRVLNQRGYVRIASVIPKIRWTDYVISLTERGYFMVQEQHNAGKGTPSFTTGDIGVFNGLMGTGELRQKKVKSKSKAKKSSKTLTADEAIQLLTARIRDLNGTADSESVQQLEAYAGDLLSGSVETKNSVLQRIMATARALASGGAPILEAAEKVKELLS